jgi:NAD(P)H-hydrate epimerase
MQIAIPEAIVSLDVQQNCFSNIPDTSKYNAIGIGPGLGCGESSKKGLKLLLEQKPENLVLDADALNILSGNNELWELLPAKTILTPHPKEFERLIGMKKSPYECWLTQMEISQKKNIIIILKGAYTSISLPDGTIHINSTGNSGMATAGSGDTLTGILTALLAQGYPPEKAAITGVWLHGKAGDLALSKQAEESLLASDIIDNIGNVYKTHNNIV